MTDPQFLWTQFGFAGFLLFLLCFLAAYLFKLWIASKENLFKHSLETQRDVHLESIRQLIKRDEIRFSKLHDKRAEIIAELYNILVETHSAVEDCYDQFKYSPEKARLKLANEAVNRCDDLAEFILRNKIYFDEELASELTELQTCLSHAASYYEMYCKEPEKEKEVKEFEGLLGEVKVDIEGSLRVAEKEFRILLGVLDRK